MAVPFPSVASRWMAALSRPPPTLQDSRRCLYRKTSSNRSRYARRIQGPRRMLTLSRLAMPATSSCRPKMSPRGRTSTRRREPKRPLLVVGPSAPSGASHKVSEIPPRAGRRLHLTNAAFGGRSPPTTGTPSPSRAPAPRRRSADLESIGPGQARGHGRRTVSTNSGKGSPPAL